MIRITLVLYFKEVMRKKSKLLIAIILVVGVLLSAALYLRTTHFPVLAPHGTVGEQERNLIMFAAGLSLVIVIPVFAITFSFAWKYREGNTKHHKKYAPNIDHNRWLETAWWSIPAVLILILSMLTWTSTHALDPFKPLSSTKKPVTIQVVAMQWKWLFLYPDKGVATVNYVEFPKDTPVTFEITSDGPMNSFWIPDLGGQIYAMSGMSTKLHLMADKAGTYRGASANISGRGFAGMRFTAKATSQAEFDGWLRSVAHDSPTLSDAAFAKLSEPSENDPSRSYRLENEALYDTIVDRFMPMHNMDDMEGMGSH